MVPTRNSLYGSYKRSPDTLPFFHAFFSYRVTPSVARIRGSFQHIGRSKVEQAATMTYMSPYFLLTKEANAFPWGRIPLFKSKHFVDSLESLLLVILFKSQFPK